MAGQFNQPGGAATRHRRRRQQTFMQTFRSTLIITPFVVALLVVIVVVLTRPNPDTPTEVSSDENLQRRSLPEMSRLNEVTDEGASASAKYIAIAEQWARDFDPDGSLETDLADALIEAGRAGRIESGFLDETILVEPMPFAGAMRDPRERWVGRLRMMGMALVDEARQIRGEGDGQRARAFELSRAAFALGHRMYAHNDRLWCRWWGLEVMRAACGGVIISAPQDDEQAERIVQLAQQWDAEIEQLIEHWRPKWELLVAGRRPNVADTVRIAESDGDISFRYEAILTLGRVQHLTTDRGNRRMIEQAFDRLEQVEHPWLQEALEAARDYRIGD